MNYRRGKEKVYKKKFTNFHLFGPKQADPKKTNSLQNLNLYSLIVQAFFGFFKRDQWENEEIYTTFVRNMVCRFN